MAQSKRTYWLFAESCFAITVVIFWQRYKQKSEPPSDLVFISQSGCYVRCVVPFSKSRYPRGASITTQPPDLPCRPGGCVSFSDMVAIVVGENSHKSLSLRCTRPPMSLPGVVLLFFFFVVPHVMAATAARVGLALALRVHAVIAYAFVPVRGAAAVVLRAHQTRGIAVYLRRPRK